MNEEELEEQINKNIEKEMGEEFYEKIKEEARKNPEHKALMEEKEEHWKQLKRERGVSKKEILEKYFDAIKDKKWAEASEVLEQWVLSQRKIYTTKNDIKSELWIYKDGIYIPDGKSEVKELLRMLLGKWYSMFVVNQVLAKIEADTYIEADRFFKINYIDEIPVLNGILNIRTLELNSYNPNKIFFSKLPVIFDITAVCPKIDKFLSEVLSDEEDRRIIYELAGFSLLKEYKFEKAFMFLGYGRNGKGKTIELFKRLVGMENCCSIPLPLLISDSFSVSELFRKLLNLAGDISNKDLKETGVFKGATGRDLISGKRKFLPDLFFVNHAKFVFACNELPMVYDMSKGFWDRWILLNFPYTFVTQEECNRTEDKTNLKIRDEDIIEKITTPEEMSGFLNQALISLKELEINKRFSTTKGSEEVKNEWIRNSNSCMAFCYDMVKEQYDGKISKKEFRRRYAGYCKKHKLKNKSDIVLKNTIQEMFGASETRILENFIQEHYWEGINWK